MEAPIIIEVLDRFGKVRERHKIKEFPVRIGRAYSNDIILDDNYVSPEHIEIMLDGEGHVLVSDLKSANGLFTLHPIQRHEVITLEDNQRIRIGHTDIRFRSERFQVRESYIDHGKPSLLHFLLTNGFVLPFIWVLTAVVTSSYYFLQSSDEFTFNSLLADIVPVFVFIVIWSCGWSIVSKVATHRFYFSYHAIVASLVVCGFYIIEPAFEYVEFNFSVQGMAEHLTIISDLVLPSLLLYAHLRQSTNLNRKKARLTAIISTVLIVGVLNLTSYINQPEFDNLPRFSHILKSPQFAVVQPESIDSFFSDVDSLKHFTISTSPDIGQDRPE